MAQERELLSALVLELRRGTLILSVLSQLKDLEYGYSLVQKLNHKGVAIDPSTLYPLLRRLEKQGFCAAGGTPVKRNRENIISELNLAIQFMLR